MSTRSTRKKGRISYKEDTPDESDAVESSQEEEDDEDEFTLSKKKKKQPTRKKGKGKRGKQESQSDSDSTSDGEEDSDTGSDGEGDDEEDTKEGVDFSRKVPYEIVAEILSYLTPRELLIFNNSSKSFHSILSGPSSRTLWAKSRKNLGIPAVELEGITEQQLATLLFNQECEICEGKVDHPDLSLCKRYCVSCRKKYWINLDDVSKLYPDLHPATTQAVQSTSFSAKARYSRHFRGSNKYSLYSHLVAASEELEILETLDAAGQPMTDDEEGAQDGDGDGDEENGSENDEDDAHKQDEEGQDEAQVGGSESTQSADQQGRRSTRATRGGAKVDYSGEGLTIQEASKMMKRSRRLKTAWWIGARQQGAELEAELESSFSPRVNRYLVEQKSRFEVWEQVVCCLQPCIETIENYFNSQEKAFTLTLRKTAQLRRSMIESKLMLFGFRRWSFTDSIWTSNDLVNAPKSLTDEEWLKLKKRFKKLAGRSIANQIWYTASNLARKDLVDKKQARIVRIAEKKVARLEALVDRDEDGEEDVEMKSVEDEEEQVVDTGEWKVKLLEKPKKISQKVWKYVLPHLQKVVTSAPELTTLENEPTQQNFFQALTYEQIKSKREFFKIKYEKIVDMQPTKARKVFLPIFNCFLRLPTIEQLYLGNPLYGAQGDVKEKKEKADEVWEKKFEEILEECEQYGVDAVTHAAEILLSLPEDSEEDHLAKLDLTHLISDAERKKPDALFPKNFFKRPSSYLICGICRDYVGSLSSVLSHQHKEHNKRKPQYSVPYGSLTSLELHPVEMSIQAAVALDRVFQLGRLSSATHDTLEDLKQDFKGKRLVWHNPPGYGDMSITFKAREWKSLICEIHRMARTNGGSNEFADISLRKKNKQERANDAVSAARRNRRH